MNEMEDFVQRFVGIWNETDPNARRATVEALWAVNGRHLMGGHDVNGYEALVARVKASHERSVVQGGNAFRPATIIQTLPGAVKFRWDMAKRDTGDVTSSGVGFLLVDEEGKITCDYLFAEA